MGPNSTNRPSSRPQTTANREPITNQAERQRTEKKAAVITKMITAGSVSRANAVVYRKNPP
eukprot:12928659-Prorocentrum_lima.AAC.1